MTPTLSGARTVVALATTLALYFRCTVGTGLDSGCVLAITKVDAPAQIGPGDAFYVTVIVEYGGWCSYESVVVTRTTGSVTIDARGRDDSGPGVRRSDIRQQSVDVRLDPPFQDPFSIIANQPTGPPTTRLVRVR